MSQHFGFRSIQRSVRDLADRTPIVYRGAVLLIHQSHNSLYSLVRSHRRIPSAKCGHCTRIPEAYAPAGGVVLRMERTTDMGRCASEPSADELTKELQQTKELVCTVQVKCLGRARELRIGKLARVGY